MAIFRNIIIRIFYLPKNITIEALKCLHPIPNFTLPNPIQNHPTLNPQSTPHTIQTTNILTWNYGTFNTALPRLQSLMKNHTPSYNSHTRNQTYSIQIYQIPTKIIPNMQNDIQQHKYKNPQSPYSKTTIQHPKGGLLTLIPQKYAFLGNVTKIPTTRDIFPYLQIIKIINHLLPTYSLIHLYKPTHSEDTIHIPTIQTIIFNHIYNNPQNNVVLLGIFNKDIASIG